MALAKASLPKVNRCHQRTHLRPREIAGAAATNVAFTAGRTAAWGASGTITAGSVWTVSTNRHRKQEYLSAGLINIAT